MIIIKTKRNKGKTTEMVRLLRENPDAILLVFGRGEILRIVDYYKLNDADAKRIVTWARYRTDPRFIKHEGPLILDNLDLFLETYLHNSNIIGVSINAIS